MIPVVEVFFSVLVIFASSKFGMNCDDVTSIKFYAVYDILLNKS